MHTLEHIGIATADAGRTAGLLRALLGVLPYKEESVEADGVRTVFIDGGGAKIELLEPLSETSPVARFLLKRGEGLHHVALEVRNIDAVMERLREEGFQPLDDAPRPGADGKRIFFLHPKDTGGILFELCESSRPTLNRVHAEADGRRSRYFQGGSPANPPLLVLGNRSLSEEPGPIVQTLERHFFILAPANGTHSVEHAASDLLEIREGELFRCVVYPEAFDAYAALVERHATRIGRSVVVMKKGALISLPEGATAPHLLLADHEDGPDLVTLDQAAQQNLGARVAVIPGSIDSALGAAVMDAFLR